MYVITWFPLSLPDFPLSPYLPPPFIDIIVITIAVPSIAVVLILLLFWDDVPVVVTIVTVLGH